MAKSLIYHVILLYCQMIATMLTVEAFEITVSSLAARMRTIHTRPTSAILTSERDDSKSVVAGPSQGFSRQHLNSLALSMSSSMSGGDYTKVFVAGASKGVGREIVKKLVDRDIDVVALVRSEEAAKEVQLLGSDGEDTGGGSVTAVIGDAFDQKSCENAMDSCDAVISTLGGVTGERRVDYEGNANVIESAGILGIPRIILVTSIGCGTSKSAAPPAVFEVLKDTLVAKEKAENLLMDFYTNVNWTIIRPGGLKTEPMTANAILTDDATAIGSIHREDVAALVVQTLSSPNTERKVLSAVDPSIMSSVAVEGKEIAAFAL